LQYIAPLFSMRTPKLNTSPRELQNRQQTAHVTCITYRKYYRICHLYVEITYNITLKNINKTSTTHHVTVYFCYN